MQCILEIKVQELKNHFINLRNHKERTIITNSKLIQEIMSKINKKK